MTAPETRVTLEDIGWATSAARHLCAEPDREAAIRLLADAFARHRQSATAAREQRMREALPIAVVAALDVHGQALGQPPLTEQESDVLFQIVAGALAALSDAGGE